MLRFAQSILLLLCLWSAASAESRTALVIGNSDYAFGPLVNPANDAKLMAGTLEKTGFKVTTLLNADRQTMQKALLTFSRDIRDKDTVGLFYYAGHGAQVAGANYLIPVDADIKAETEVKIFGIDVDEFVATLERADGRTNIVILDSCRNNPFGASTRAIKKGRTAIDAPAGTFIAFSTAPGQIALDGDGQNSPYATALSKAMLQPNTALEQTFKITRRNVLDVTQKVQTPWESSSLTGDFFFTPAKTEAATPVIEKKVEPEPEVDQQVAVAEQKPATTEGYRELTLQPQVFPVGKWPEGIAIANNAIYVAESGARRMVKLDPGSGDLLEYFNTGRLPVNVAADTEGNVYANAITDGKIFKQPVEGKGKAIASFKRPTYVQGLVAGNGAVYTASYDEVENRQTVISRIDAISGRAKKSSAFGVEPRALTFSQQLWLLDAANAVTALDSDSLSQTGSITDEGFMWSMTANADAVFVGGREEQMQGKSVVYRHDQSKPDNRLKVVLDSEELIVAMAANTFVVVALGIDGTYWILDAATLKPLKVIKSGKRPQAAVLENRHLFVTTHQGEGENGAVLIYENVGGLD